MDLGPLDLVTPATTRGRPVASRIGAYDNAAEFPAAVPTFAHYLRHLGYRTCLSGKMHFVGPDQLHGFEQRVTTDIYPSDFGWTPDWTAEQTQAGACWPCSHLNSQR